jgi:hypothetical protein
MNKQLFVPPRAFAKTEVAGMKPAEKLGCQVSLRSSVGLLKTLWPTVNAAIPHMLEMAASSRDMLTRVGGRCSLNTLPGHFGRP